MSKEKLIELELMMKDMKRDLKTLEQNEIRSTHSNTWSIKGTLEDMDKDIDNIIGTINSNIKDLEVYVQQLPNYMYDNFNIINENIKDLDNNSKDNEKLKAIIEEQIDQLNYQDTVVDFSNKVEVLKRLVKHL